MPWNKKTEIPGVVAPADRIKQLRELGEKAPSMPELEQIRESTRLAQSIQNENDPLIRIQILKTLASFSTPVSTAVLNAAVNDGDSDVRTACCDAWAQRGGPEALQVLTKIMSSDVDIDVRMAAMRAMGKLGDPAAIAVLAPALDDKNPAVQFRAVQSLKQISGRDFGDDVSAWRDFANGGKPPEQTIADRLLRWF
jgi:hypothetical protein